MADRKKLARFHLVDGLGNRSTLDAYDGDGAVYLSLATRRGVPEATSNLRADLDHPAFWGNTPDGVRETLARLERWASSGYRKVVRVERHPDVVKSKSRGVARRVAPCECAQPDGTPGFRCVRCRGLV